MGGVPRRETPLAERHIAAERIRASRDRRINAIRNLAIAAHVNVNAAIHVREE